MAKPKITKTITRKEWNKKHKDFKLMGRDGIPYIMAYDDKIGTHLVPVKIVESQIEEGIASAIDQIRQDSKDIRDFLKKVFSDSDFRDMKNDKDFIQYLKSIYEGVNEEENESVNEGTKYKVGQKTPVGKIVGTSVWGKGRKQEWFYDIQKPGYSPVQYSEKSLDKIMGESVNEVNTRLNKKVKSYLDVYLKGEKKNSPEHQHAIMLIMKGALTDANFHSEARQLDKFFPKAKQSKHVGTQMEDVIEDKGVDIAKWAKWDGYDIIDAFAFYTNMNIGGGFGNKLTALKESVTETINERLNTRDMKYMDGLALRKPLDTALKELRKVGQDLIDSEGFDKGDVKEFLLSKVSRVLHVGLNESNDLNKKN